MASITDIAQKFFDACETGKGWQGCQQYCTANATFRSEATPLAGMKTLAEYTNWMQGMFTLIPDGSYRIKSFATDSARNNVAAYGIFSGTHTGEGGPVPPTGKRIDSGLRLRHGVRRRQDQAHDEDLERRRRPEGPRLGGMTEDVDACEATGGAAMAVLAGRSACAARARARRRRRRGSLARAAAGAGDRDSRRPAARP